MSKTVENFVPAAFEKLAPREREVATLSYGGMTSAEVAERLGIKSTSVRATLHRVYVKLDVSGLQELRSLANQGSNVFCEDPIADDSKGLEEPLLFEVLRSLVGMLSMLLLTILLGLPNIASADQSTLAERVAGLAIAAMVYAVAQNITRMAQHGISRIGFPVLSLLSSVTTLFAMYANWPHSIARLSPLGRIVIDAFAFLLLMTITFCCFKRVKTVHERLIGLLETWICAIAAYVAVLSGGAIFISTALCLLLFAASMLFAVEGWHISGQDEDLNPKRAIEGSMAATGFLLGLVAGLFLLSVADFVAKLPAETEALLLLFILFVPLRGSLCPVRGEAPVFRLLLLAMTIALLFGVGNPLMAIVTFFLVAYYFAVDGSCLSEMLGSMSVGLTVSVLFSLFDCGALRFLPLETYSVAAFSIYSTAEVGLLFLAWHARREAKSAKALTALEKLGNDSVFEKMDALMVVAGCSAFQRDVVLSTARGETARSIGERTGYSLATVKTARMQAYRKLGVGDIGGFIDKAAGRGAA